MFQLNITNFLKVAGPTIFSSNNKYRVLTNVTSFKYQNNGQIQTTNTVRIKWKHQSGPFLHCTGSQLCSLCVTESFPPIQTRFLLNFVITNTLSISQDSLSWKIAPSCLSLWSQTGLIDNMEETLYAVAGLEIVSHATGQVAIEVTCEGSDTCKKKENIAPLIILNNSLQRGNTCPSNCALTCYILLIFVSPFSFCLFLFAFSCTENMIIHKFSLTC